jgi:hypothetical protein
MPKPPTTKSGPGSGTTTKESDIVANEVLFAHAEQERLVRALLGGAFSSSTASDAQEIENAADGGLGTGTKSDFKLEKNADPDIGGLGFEPPKDSTGGMFASSRASDPTTLFLRKQLLGGSGRNGGFRASAPGGNPSRPFRTQRNGGRGVSDDEEEGRSGVGKGKKNKNKNTNANGQQSIVLLDTGSAQDRTVSSQNVAGVEGSIPPDEQHHIHVGPVSAATGSKKRGTSYLDEVLAKRAKKKNKKNKKTDGGQEQPNG